jgi:hypothetical protein
MHVETILVVDDEDRVRVASAPEVQGPPVTGGLTSHRERCEEGAFSPDGQTGPVTCRSRMLVRSAVTAPSSARRSQQTP